MTAESRKLILAGRQAVHQNGIRIDIGDDVGASLALGVALVGNNI